MMGSGFRISRFGSRAFVVMGLGFGDCSLGFKGIRHDGI